MSQSLEKNVTISGKCLIGHQALNTANQNGGNAARNVVPLERYKMVEKDILQILKQKKSRKAFKEGKKLPRGLILPLLRLDLQGEEIQFRDQKGNLFSLRRGLGESK